MLTVPDLIGILLFVFDLFGPIKALYTQATRLTVMNSCMDRIEEVFSQPELPDEGLEKIPSASHGPEVEFRNVRFGYEEKEVLHDLSFLLPKNQMLALVGPSGGGKSTIANLLTRFWDVKSGQILIRGTDIRKVKLADLMDHISMVFQRGIPVSGHHLQQYQHGTAGGHPGRGDGGGEKSKVLRLYHGAA